MARARSYSWAWMLVVCCACGRSSRAPEEATPATSTPSVAREAPVASAVRDSDAGAPASNLRCDGRPVSPQLAGLGCRSNRLGRLPAGFSKDGKYLGVCFSDCESCGLHCTFEARSGAPLRFAEFDTRHDPRAIAIQSDRALTTAQRDQKLERLERDSNGTFSAKLAELGLTGGAQGDRLSGEFPYPEIRLTHQVSYDNDADVGVVEVGGQLGEEKPVYPLRLTLPPHPGRKAWKESAAADEQLDEGPLMQIPELIYFDVSVDGADVGAVAAASGLLWVEQAKTARMAASEFAGRIFNDTGVRVLARGEAAGAAALLARAQQIAPTSSLFAYNLACARARAGAGDVQEALAQAIKLGGAAVKQRAKADADLASVRAEAWFVALTK